MVFNIKQAQFLKLHAICDTHVETETNVIVNLLQASIEVFVLRSKAIMQFPPQPSMFITY